MKKDIVEVVNFLFEGSQDCVMNNVGLIVQNNYFRVILNSEQNIPEYIKIAIKEGTLNSPDLIVEQVEICKVEPLIKRLCAKLGWKMFFEKTVLFS